jgi:hypothetical protein
MIGENGVTNIDRTIEQAPDEFRDALESEREAYKRIHETTKAVLAEVGIETRNKAVISILEGTGLAGYDASNSRIYLLPDLIDQSIESAAKTFSGDEGQNTLGIGGIPPFLYRETDSYPMPATYEELEHLIEIVAENLDVVRFLSQPVKVHKGAPLKCNQIMDREGWTLDRVSSRTTGSRSGWWGVSEASEGFLDQLVTWRELGFNICWQREDYDRYESLPRWALTTLADHEGDRRPYGYSPEEFEAARTHDPLWNAAQMQLVRKGWIHNYLRMLWGKKILGWAASPRDALNVMIELKEYRKKDAGQRLCYKIRSINHLLPSLCTPSWRIQAR